jgi:hypothetical protein
VFICGLKPQTHGNLQLPLFFEITARYEFRLPADSVGTIVVGTAVIGDDGVGLGDCSGSITGVEDTISGTSVGKFVVFRHPVIKNIRNNTGNT